MLRSAKYKVSPYESDPRRHKVPVEVIEHLTGVRNQTALDGSRCLLSIFILTHSAQAQVLPPIVLPAMSGGEIRVGKRACPDYPDSLLAGAFLAVEITKLD